MEYFGIMETHKLLLQRKEQGSVKGLESASYFMWLCSYQNLELAETMILCSSYELEVSLLWQRFESRKPTLGLLNNNLSKFYIFRTLDFNFTSTLMTLLPTTLWSSEFSVG
jgi:hypothetical protein